MHRRHFHLLTIVALLLFPRLSSAQPSYKSSDFRFQHYDTNDGLASEYANQIVQDSAGFLWILHHNGLSRYDGYTFKRYYQKDEAGPGPPLDGRLELDRHRNLWLISNQSYQPNGELILSRFYRQKDRFVRYFPDLTGAFAMTICADKDDRTIWIGTWGKGLFSYDIQTGNTKSFINISVDSVTALTPDSPMEQRNIIFGISDRGPHLLLATLRGFWMFEKETLMFSQPKCHASDSSWLNVAPIIAMIDSAEYSNSLSFVVYNEGLFEVDRNFSNKSVSLLASLRDLKLPTCLTRDKFGVFWFTGYSDGLHRFDPTNKSLMNIKANLTDPHGIRTNSLNGLTVDRDQNLWVTTLDQGICKLPRQGIRFYNYHLNSQIMANELYEANNKTSLVLSNEQNNKQMNAALSLAAVVKTDLANIQFQQVKLDMDLKGTITQLHMGKSLLWVGTSRDGLLGFPISKASGIIEPQAAYWFSHHPKNSNTIYGNPQNGGNIRISAIWEDSKRHLWVGNADVGGGLNKINLDIPYGEEGSVERYNHVAIDSTSLSHNIIWWEMFPEGDNGLWTVTAAGLDLFKNGSFEHYFTNDYVMTVKRDSQGTLLVGTSSGLYKGIGGKQYSFEKYESPILSNGAFAFEEDSLGRLWISSLKSMKCFDRKKNSIAQFGEAEGFDFGRDWIEKTSEGVFVSIGTEGISLFDPYSFQFNETVYRPVLTRLTINNEPPKIQSTDDYPNSFQIKNDISVLDELALDYRHNNFSIEFSAMQMTSPEKNFYKHKLDGFDPDWIETDANNRTATYTNLDVGTYTFKVKASNHHGIWSDKETTLKIVVLPPPWRTTWAYTGYAMIFIGILWVARRNIVQRERLKSNLKLAKVEQEKEHFELEKAKEVDKVKSAFFTNISHEFRTPLTLIKGPVADMLEEYANNPKTKENLKLVQRNSDLLLKLINQLLDLAKLESGSLTVEKTKVDLLSFLAVTINSFSSLALQKNIELDSEVSNAGYIVSVDKDKLETILINLINNAIKFTSAGGKVMVSARVQGSQLTINVNDNGIGIPQDQQEKIFERFHQVSETHKEVGTGIGLSLVKELVVLMGGRISVSSEYGKGSQFSVALPIELVTATEGQERVSDHFDVKINGVEKIVAQENHATVDSMKPKVLVVEDNTDLRKFIIESLRTDYQFLEAADGKQGLEIAIESMPDLIVSDVMMPEMDGITMTGKIKKDTRTSHIPVILLTAKTSDESKLSGLSTGADDYLTKPFNKHELLLKVRNSIALRVKLRERVRLELLKEAPKVEVQSADEKFLLRVKEAILSQLADEQLSVESLAEEIALSRSQLLRKVTALTGVSVNELIRTFRLQKAAQLLEQNWGPVTQVAYEVGFSNLSYFSKVFKEQYGVLPSEYMTTKGVSEK